MDYCYVTWGKQTEKIKNVLKLKASWIVYKTNQHGGGSIRSRAYTTIIREHTENAVSGKVIERILTERQWTYRTVKNSDNDRVTDVISTESLRDKGLS